MRIQQNKEIPGIANWQRTFAGLHCIKHGLISQRPCTLIAIDLQYQIRVCPECFLEEGPTVYMESEPLDD